MVAFEVAEVGGFGSGKLDLADDVFALVVEQAALGGDGGVVAGEVEVDVDGVGGLIDDVAGGEGDVEAVAPVAGGAEIDGDGARLVVEGPASGADDARADQQQRAGLVGVLSGGELVVEFDGLVESRRAGRTGRSRARRRERRRRCCFPSIRGAPSRRCT